MHDRLSDGRKFRLLTVVDAFSGECIALEVPDGFKSMDVIKALRRAIARHGKPQTLRCDYGSEFTLMEFDQWASWNSIAIDFSRPGKPTDNALVESFNGPRPPGIAQSFVV
jgi:putative transposase